MENLSINQLWKQYNDASNALAKKLGRTYNIVGDFAEHLAKIYLNGELFDASKSGADIKSKEGKLYQIKSRKMDKLKSTSLNVIRSWDFDYLLVLLFDREGEVLKAIESPVNIAKEYGKRNEHQNGWVITTNKDFLNEERNKDLTDIFNNLLNT